MPFIFAFCTIVLLLSFIALMSQMDRRAAFRRDAALAALRNENDQLKQRNSALQQHNDQLQQRLARNESDKNAADTHTETEANTDTQAGTSA